MMVSLIQSKTCHSPCDSSRIRDKPFSESEIFVILSVEKLQIMNMI